MRRRILTIGSTDIYLHLGTLLFALYAFLTGFLPMLLIASISILLHESAHAIVSTMLGRPPQEIEITPMGAVMRLDDEEALPPLRRTIMLLAGPAMTLLLCFAALWLTQMKVLQIDTGRMLFMSNLSILLLNLLPAYPLDGGRILFLLLASCLPAAVSRRVMRMTGTVIGVCAVAANLWLTWRYGGWNLSLASAGCFILYSTSAALTTQAMAELRMLMDRKIALESRGYMPCRMCAILSRQPLRQAIRQLAPGHMTVFLLMEEGTLRLTGHMTEAQAIAEYLGKPEQTCGDACLRVHGS